MIINNPFSIKPYGLPSKVEKELTQNWKKIRNEYKSLAENEKIEYSEKQKAFFDKGKWKVFPLRSYPLGDKMNLDKCLYTNSVLDKIPRLKAAGFSILKPNMKIHPHKGLKDNTLRYHLGLIIPPHIYIKIEGVTHFWEEGKILKFDDSKTHEVNNPTNKERVILLFDVEEKFSFSLFIYRLLTKPKIKKLLKKFFVESHMNIFIIL